MKIHKANAEIKLSVNLLHLSSGSLSNTSAEVISLQNIRDNACKAELQWTIKVMVSNFSCGNVAEIFNSMFPEAVPKDLTLSNV